MALAGMNDDDDKYQQQLYEQEQLQQLESGGLSCSGRSASAAVARRLMRASHVTPSSAAVNPNSNFHLHSCVYGIGKTYLFCLLAIGNWQGFHSDGSLW